MATKTPNSPLFERCDDSIKGRHLRATTRIETGRLLWAERPLLSLQSRDNLRSAFVCSHCHAFLGSSHVAMRRRFRPNAALTSKDDDTHSPVVACRQGCGHFYCCKDCEGDAWARQHRVLCTGACDDIDHPLVALKQFAVETNEILLLAVEWWVAQHLCQKSHQADKYQDFCMEPWWEVETLDLRLTPGGFAEAAELEISLRGICQEAADRFNQAMERYNTEQQQESSSSSPSPPIPPMTALDIAKRVGACSQNAMGIRQRHPMCRDVFDRSLRETWHQEIVQALEEAGFIGDDEEENDDADENDCKENDKDKDGNAQVSGTSSGKQKEWDYSVDEIAAFLSGLFIDEDGTVDDLDAEQQERDTTGDDLDYMFPPLDGTAMYWLTCKMNHSCDPNVIVLYKRTRYGPKHPLTAFVVALRAIEPHEELTISYIDKNESYQTRQAALSTYGFVCQCSKCEREKNGEAEHQSTAVATSIESLEDDLFGTEETNECSDDEIDRPGKGSETDGKTAEGSEEAALEKVLSRLDTLANHSKHGSIPLPFIAMTSSFAIEIAKAVTASIKNNTVIELVDRLVGAVESKDFCLWKIVGKDLEQYLFHLLQIDMEWKDGPYREAYWCSILFATMGYTHECSFVQALNLLDKGMIMGLPRMDPRLSGIIQYVEQHASQMASGWHNCFIGDKNTVADYRDPNSSQLLQDFGLSRPLQRPIRETESELSSETFKNDYVALSCSLVIRNFASQWGAIRKWRDLQRLSDAHGHRLVPLEIGSMLAGTMKEQVISIRHFVFDYLVKSSCKKVWSLQDATHPQSNVAYLAQHPLLDQIPSLRDDVDMSPSLLGEDGPTHVYAWIGTGGTRTPMHFDSYDNLFVQLVGAKYVRQYDRQETAKLYTTTTKSSVYAQGNMSDVDCEREDFEKHPLAKDAAFTEVLLLPGDCLFIPAGTWHYVRSLSTSVSINYWF